MAEKPEDNKALASPVDEVKFSERFDRRGAAPAKPPARLDEQYVVADEIIDTPYAKTPAWQRASGRAFVPLCVLVVVLLIACAVLSLQNYQAHNRAQQLRRQLDASTLQVASLQSRMASIQGQLTDSEKASVQMAAVADSMKTCIEQTEQFQSDYLSEQQSGFFSPIVSQEAQNAGAACAKANTDYNTLLSEFQLATSRASA